MDGPVFDVLGHCRRQRSPQFGSCGLAKLGRHDAHDGMEISFKDDRFTKKRRIRSELSLPKSVTQSDDTGGTNPIFIGTKCTSLAGFDSQHAEALV